MEIAIGHSSEHEGPDDVVGSDFSSAFQAVAAYFDRPTSETVLLSGVPIDIDKPSYEDIERIAVRIGLETKLLRPHSELISAANLPVLVFTRSQGVLALLEETEPGIFSIGSLHKSGHEQISLDQLDQLKSDQIVSFSTIYLNEGERAIVGGAKTIERRSWLWGTLSVFWTSYINVVLAAFFINIIGLATPIFVLNVYDRILPNQAISSLWVLGIGVTVALFFDFLLKSARSAIIDHTGRVADQKLSYLLFEKVMNTKMSARTGSTGEFSNRVGQYEFVREFFTSNTLSVVIDSMFVFVFVIVIYSISGWLAIIPVIAFVLTLIVGLTAQYFIARNVARAANEASERNSLLVESISTVETIKSLRAEARFIRKWSELSKNASKTSLSIKQISARATSLTQFIQQLVTITIVIAGAYEFSAGNITTGAIIATVMLASRTVAPLGQIAMTLARFRQAILSLKILNGIMSQPEDMPQSVGFVNRPIKSGTLSFQSVDFTYPETDNAVLSNLTFSVKAGERVGIIGKIGSGKTTLGKLLGGLYEPTGGRLLIDGVDIRQYHLSEVRKAVAFVGQDADLFSGTLKENLLLAKPEASDEELIEVAKKTGVDDFASRHPRGYDMAVGERGDRLSGGQKQAVVMARLLLAEPRIVFLDEPTAAMDLASERTLLRTLAQAYKRETTLLISTHRYSLLELVDRIIVLDNGRLVVDGPKEQVMAKLMERAKAAANSA